MGIAVVTGGTAGVGRATARELARRGWDVAVIARGLDRIDATVREIEEMGRRGLGLPVDVADATAVAEAAARIERELGPIDVWINNAFGGFIAPFLEVSMEEFHRVTGVSYHGFVHGTRAALDVMLPRDSGTIIQVGSALAFRGIPLQSAYCGAKHAIVGFSESVLTELKNQGSAVRVCMVHLPAVNTPQFDWVLRRVPGRPMPVPPIYQPEVPAGVIADVAARPRRTTWVGLPTALTILGNTLAPRLLDAYLARTGVRSQQDFTMPLPTDPPNLFQAAPGDHGAHGSFDDRAHAVSLQTTLVRYRWHVAAAGTAAVLAAAGRRLPALSSRR